MQKICMQYLPFIFLPFQCMFIKFDTLLKKLGRLRSTAVLFSNIKSHKCINSWH